MKALAPILALVAAPALAEDLNPDLIGFFEYRGCTIGPESRAAARGEGWDDMAIDALRGRALADGLARRAGEDYVVLSADLCTIRIPDFPNALPADGPEIAGIFEPLVWDPAYGPRTDLDHGCFLGDFTGLVEALHPDDPEAAWRTFIETYAAGFVSGDLTFYSPDPLRTPVGIQLLTGDCADIPLIDDIRAHQALFTDETFDRFVRTSLATTRCVDDSPAFAVQQEIWAIQGADPGAEADPEASFNVNFFLELRSVAMAAGFWDGASLTERGTMRPPMCHYPE